MHPDVAEYRCDLAISHTNIGIAFRDIGRADESLASAEAAVEILQSLVNAYPAVSQFRSNLANSLDEAGDALRRVGRMDEARASFERALEIGGELVKANPTVTGDRSYPLRVIVLQGLRGLGITDLARGRIAEAAANWRRAIAEGNRMATSDPESLYVLATCHARLGGIAGAPGSGLSAEEGRAELDKAMDVLRRAVAGGYRSLNLMERDSDLDPLRSRRDFQALLMDLAMPDDPFAR
jgi:tetratricopeptide (TPR) repeat protein